MESQIDKVSYSEKYELMPRVINLLHFKGSKGDDVFNINVRRPILVHSDDTNKTYIVFARRFGRRSFPSGGSCFNRCDKSWAFSIESCSRRFN